MLVTMTDILAEARKGQYAAGYFNILNLEMAEAVIDTAEALKAPVIIGIGEVLLPTTTLERAASFLLPMSKKARIPVCVHYDHGLTFEKCMEALKQGFTSIMYDCSTAPYEENVSRMAEMVRICHAFGASVEGELGHVGDNDENKELMAPSDFYTDPDIAADFVRRTGVDALAIAVGNAHGDYKFPPKLDFERITEIAEKTDIPLVLHGGSGLSDDDFREAIQRGITKVNIFTDLNKAGKAGLEKGIAAGAKNMTQLIPYEIKEMSETVKEKILLFGSAGKA